MPAAPSSPVRHGHAVAQDAADDDLLAAFTGHLSPRLDGALAKGTMAIDRMMDDRRSRFRHAGEAALPEAVSLRCRGR